jgi:hypothetical protein
MSVIINGTGSISGLTAPAFTSAAISYDTSVSYSQGTLGLALQTVTNVKNAPYNAKGDGSTDDTTAIQAAITAVATAGGGVVFIPPGSYKITGAFTIAGNGVRIVGAGMYATRLRHFNTDSGTFRVTVDVDYFEIADLTVEHDVTATATAGFVIQTEASGILGGLVNRFRTVGVFAVAKNTITSGSVNNVTFRDCICLATIKYGLWLQYTVDWILDSCIFEIASRNANTAGMVIESANDGLYTNKVLFLSGEKGTVCQSTLGTGSRHFFFEQTAWDGAGVNALELSALRRSRFVNCWFASVYSTCNGVNINGSANYGLIFSACIFLNIAGHGALIQGGATDINFSACQFTDWGVAAAATYSGIITAANAGTRFSVVNCQFFADSDFSGNPWRGVTVNSGAYDTYLIQGNTGSGLTGALIVDAGTSSTARVVDNIGYNPVGISSFLAGTSPYTYTAGHTDETVYVRGGTVSSITQGGGTLFTNTDNTMHLGPNESIIITYSVQPTVSVQKH